MRLSAAFARLVALAAASLGLLAGTPPAASADSDDLRELVIGITQFPSTLHPTIDSMLAKSYALGLARRPMMVYDHEWKHACMLCTEVPSIEAGTAVVEPLPDGGEGMAVSYALDPRAKWGDGTPITTRDAVFSWEVGRHPQSGVAAHSYYRRILSIEVHDDHRYTVHYDRLYYNYPTAGAFSLLPEHLERDIFEQDPATYRNRTRYETEPANPGLYHGPYLVTEVERGSHIRFERNPNWWGREPYFERIVVRTIENTVALEANLLSGTVDYIAGELGLPIDQAIAFEERHGDRFVVEYKPGLIFEHLTPSFDSPILRDARVRRALLTGLDRQAISERLFGGRQPVADTNVNPLDWIHHDGVRKYAYDPAAAAAMLDEAGWTPGDDGVRRNASGEPLRFELMTTAGDRTRELVEQVIQSQWRELGVDVRIRNEPPRVYFGETVAKRKFTGFALFAWVSSPESSSRGTLHSEEIPRPENGWSGNNVAGYSNPEADRLTDAIEVELEREPRRALWAELQTLYAEDLPDLPLYFRANAYIRPKWLVGVRPTGHQFSSTLWVEEWRRAPEGE
jgi:peptide/nickel transport system substrate-binding protein